MANITLLLREGYFLCPESGEMYTEVSGRFTGISTAKYKGFIYWSVGLSDGCDEMRVLLQLKSSAFANLVLSLVGCKFRVLTLQPYLEKWHGKEIKKLSVYVDGDRYSAPYQRQAVALRLLRTPEKIGRISGPHKHVQRTRIRLYLLVII